MSQRNKKYIRSYFELNENKGTTYLNLWGTKKQFLRKTDSTTMLTLRKKKVSNQIPD